MQLYATLCNNATYATILQLYETILQQFHMQLYATMQLCNMQLMQLKQLYGTYATSHNFMQLYTTYATMQLYATYATILQQFCMQLYATMQHATYATYATLCNSRVGCYLGILYP